VKTIKIKGKEELKERETQRERREERGAIRQET
jgi:hypothetical protein